MEILFCDIRNNYGSYFPEFGSGSVDKIINFIQFQIYTGRLYWIISVDLTCDPKHLKNDLLPGNEPSEILFSEDP